ncbi:hypothetical protein MD484_g7333, partial [Candolleomyces efflorescens]
MANQLKRVSKLTITFLVDNNIEWMTKLPPGFTHELNQHVPRSHPSSKDQGGVPVLDFNDFCCGAHGFAALLETETEREYTHTLFDTGPDSLSLVRNIKALQVPITKIDRVVTSHWHSDHTGGLLSFLALRKKCVEEGVTTPPPTGTEKPCIEKIDPEAPVAPCVVDVHPSRPHLRGIAPPPTWKSVLCALPKDPSFEEISAAGGVLKKHKDGHTVANGTVWISGEIPRVTEFEKGLLGGVRWVEKGEQGWTEEREIGPIGEDATGRWIAEPHLMDERYAAVDVEGKGLVLFSSCSHAGIVNVAKDAVRTFDRPIYMVVGGLHLASADLYPRIDPTVSFFSESLRPSPTYILPMHCTGWKAKVALEKELGEGVVPTGVGHRVEIQGSREDDGKLWVKIAD